MKIKILPNITLPENLHGLPVEVASTIVGNYYDVVDTILHSFSDRTVTMFYVIKILPWMSHSTDFLIDVVINENCCITKEAVIKKLIE